MDQKMVIAIMTMLIISLFVNIAVMAKVYWPKEDPRGQFEQYSDYGYENYDYSPLEYEYASYSYSEYNWE